MGEERAIVTDIAGTTRDVLSEHIRLKGLSLNIIDTAGIRDTEDVIEKIGVNKAFDYAKESDLIIYVIDSSVSLDQSDYDIIHLLSGRRAIIILNKSDLDTLIDISDVRERYLIYNSLDEWEEIPIIEISAKNGYGIDVLEEKIKEIYL